MISKLFMGKYTPYPTIKTAVVDIGEQSLLCDLFKAFDKTESSHITVFFLTI